MRCGGAGGGGERPGHVHARHGTPRTHVRARTHARAHVRRVKKEQQKEGRHVRQQACAAWREAKEPRICDAAESVERQPSQLNNIHLNTPRRFRGAVCREGGGERGHQAVGMAQHRNKDGPASQ